MNRREKMLSPGFEKDIYLKISQQSYQTQKQNSTTNPKNWFTRTVPLVLNLGAAVQLDFIRQCHLWI